MFPKAAAPSPFPPTVCEGSECPNPRQHLYLSEFLDSQDLSGKCYFIVVWLCISLMTDDVKHHFMCLFGPPVLSSLEKCLFKAFAHF